MRKISSKTSSKYKGVSWASINKNWRSVIKYNNKNLNVGSFYNEIEAAKAYDKMAKKLYGDFACLNFK